MPHPPFHRLLTLVAAAAFSASAPRSDARSSPKLDAAETARAVDAEFDKIWRANRIRPSNPTTDSEFLRRASLDLAGTIPPAESVTPFLSDKDPDKRRKLIESLLASPAFARQQSISWSNALLGYPTEIQFLAQAPFRGWLEREIDKGTSFDAITRQILTATGTPAENPAAVWTIHLEAKPESLARDASRFFLGVQVGCAECHDHPFDRWTQKDFYGLAAFFAGTAADRKFITQSVSFKPGQTIRLGGTADGEIIAPRTLSGDLLPAGAAAGDTRIALANWITGPKNPQFARAVANRMWEAFLGRGIVHPVDEFGASNPAVSQPALDHLAAAFAASDYDLRFLAEAITLTDVYQLSSVPAPDFTRENHLFAKAKLRRLTPEQLVASAVMSTGLGSDKDLMDNGLIKLILAGVQQEFYFTFANMDESTTVSDFNGTVAQALMLMNSSHIAGITDINLLSPLFGKLIKAATPDSQVDLLVKATLTRGATAAEKARLGGAIAKAASFQEKADACDDIYWALLNSAEFSLIK